MEKNTNNVMAYNLNLSSQWLVNPAVFVLFFLFRLPYPKCPSGRRKHGTSLNGRLDTRQWNPQEVPLDTIPYEDRIVNESRKTSVTFYNDIQSYSAGLREVTRRTNLSLGYRILVISDRSDAVVSQVMDEFYRSYRNLPTYKVFNSPYTELKAGDFSTYLEASYWAYQMKSDFRGAYVVQEVVNRRKK